MRSCRDKYPEHCIGHHSLGRIYNCPVNVSRLGWSLLARAMDGVSDFSVLFSNRPTIQRLESRSRLLPSSEGGLSGIYLLYTLLYSGPNCSTAQAQVQSPIRWVGEVPWFVSPSGGAKIYKTPLDLAWDTPLPPGRLGLGLKHLDIIWVPPPPLPP